MFFGLLLQSFQRGLARDLNKDAEQSHAKDNIDHGKNLSPRGHGMKIAVADGCERDDAKVHGIEPVPLFDKVKKNCAADNQSHFEPQQRTKFGDAREAAQEYKQSVQGKDDLEPRAHTLFFREFKFVHLLTRGNPQIIPVVERHTRRDAFWNIKDIEITSIVRKNLDAFVVADVNASL